MKENSSDPAVNKAGSAKTVPGQYLTFLLAGEEFGIPVLTVQEIRGWEAVSKTPRAPDYVLGIMNLRGAVVPVLDLRIRLGMEPSERTPTSVVIVVRVEPVGAAVTVGCLVDAVSDVVSLAADDGKPPPTACGAVDTHFLSGVAMIDKQLIMLIDVNRLVETSVTGPVASAAA
jgi:purine-binding chemotaxis protein CheW